MAEAVESLSDAAMTPDTPTVIRTLIPRCRLSLSLSLSHAHVGVPHHIALSFPGHHTRVPFTFIPYHNLPG